MNRKVETRRSVVQPRNCDAIGHMNTRFYAEIFDTASVHALHEVMPATEVSDADLGWADVTLIPDQCIR